MPEPGGGAPWSGPPWRQGPPWMHRGRRRWEGEPPPWWPAGESWPPEPGAWAGMRRRFMRRVIVFVALAFVLFVAALSLLVSLAWHAAERGPAFVGVVLLAIGALLLLRGVR